MTDYDIDSLDVGSVIETSCLGFPSTVNGIIINVINSDRGGFPYYVILWNDDSTVTHLAEKHLINEGYRLLCL